MEQGLKTDFDDLLQRDDEEAAAQATALVERAD